MYQNTPADGFIGGSSFERWPVERSVSDTLALFNATTSLSSGQKSLEYHLKKNARQIRCNWSRIMLLSITSTVSLFQISVSSPTPPELILAHSFPTLLG